MSWLCRWGEPRSRAFVTESRLLRISSRGIRRTSLIEWSAQIMMFRNRSRTSTRCSPELSWRWHLVSPTYCLPHFLHSITKVNKVRYLFKAMKTFERVGISLVEVYERAGRSVISVSKKAKKAALGAKPAERELKDSRNWTSFLVFRNKSLRNCFHKKVISSEVLLYTDSTEPTLDTDTKRTAFCKTAESLKKKKHCIKFVFSIIDRFSRRCASEKVQLYVYFYRFQSWKYLDPLQQFNWWW